MKNNFSLMIKPASSSCNLRCSYCFYLGKCKMFGDSVPRMNDNTLATITRKYMALHQPQPSFCWQGGEPTLMGVDFFRRAVELQRQYAAPGQVATNALQTNGTLLDDSWGEFLAANRFLVGVSVDGPAEIHDVNRVDVNGNGTHAEVMRGMAILQKHHVEFNVLTLVSATNQDHPVGIYRYLKSLGINYHQYIECVEFDSEGRLRPYAVDPVKWGKFLCAVFDEWYPADTRKVSVRLFDTILAKLVDRVATCCQAGTDCRQYFVVEHNGDVFPCDFFVRPELKLGNICSSDFPELSRTSIYHDFGARKQTWNSRCDQCEYLPLCVGDCPKNRPGSDFSSLSALCEGWRLFYAHTMTRFQRLAEEIVAERQRPTGQSRKQPGRNDPCSCGSGKKYKKCCGS